MRSCTFRVRQGKNEITVSRLSVRRPRPQIVCVAPLLTQAAAEAKEARAGMRAIIGNEDTN